MTRKLPVIIDNRSSNTVLQALQKLLPNLQRMDIATGMFEIGSFLLLQGLWHYLTIFVLSLCGFGVFSASYGYLEK